MYPKVGLKGMQLVPPHKALIFPFDMYVYI